MEKTANLAYSILDKYAIYASILFANTAIF